MPQFLSSIYKFNQQTCRNARSAQLRRESRLTPLSRDHGDLGAIHDFRHVPSHHPALGEISPYILPAGFIGIHQHRRGDPQALVFDEMTYAPLASLGRVPARAPFSPHEPTKCQMDCSPVHHPHHRNHCVDYASKDCQQW